MLGGRGPDADFVSDMEMALVVIKSSIIKTKARRYDLSIHFIGIPMSGEVDVQYLSENTFYDQILFRSYL